MRYLLLVFLCILSYFVNAQELYTSCNVSKEFTEKVKLFTEIETRFQYYGPLVKNVIGEIGGSYSFTKKIDFSTSYKFSQRQRENGFFPSHTIAGAFTYKTKIDKFRFSYRNKLEYSKNTYITSEEDLFPEIEDRNRIKLQYSRKKYLSPTVFLESFHSISSISPYAFTELRVGGSFEFDLKKGFTIGLGVFNKVSYTGKKSQTLVGEITISKSFK